MIRRKKDKRKSSPALQRFLRATNRGWILDPALSDPEEWTECVRAKRRDDDVDINRGSDSDELSEEFDD